MGYYYNCILCYLGWSCVGVIVICKAHNNTDGARIVRKKIA